MPLIESSTPAVAIQSGLLADIPAAGVPNSYYWATDVQMLYRDNGVIWEAIAHGNLDGVAFAQHHNHFVRWIGQPPTRIADTGTITANRMSFVPMQIPFMATLKGIYVENGGVVGTDNWVLAFYESGGTPIAPTTRRAITAATLTAGASQRQYIPFTATYQVVPGLYYACAWKSGSTDNHRRATWDENLNPTGDDNLPQYYNEDNAGGPQAIATPTACTLKVNTIWQVLVVDSVP